MQVTQSDGEIVAAVLAGDREVFGELVQRYERAVRAVALEILGRDDAAADASQEAFVRAYASLAGLRKPAAFGGWLMRIARNAALDLVRRGRNEVSLDHAAADPVAGNGELDEDKQQLLSAVLRLPEPERQVVMLRYFNGHGVKDVSLVTGRSVGTVTKQLSRAHERLRNMLGKSHDTR